MTDCVNGDLTLCAKINRLFDVFRARDESEQSVQAVADSVTRIIGKSVTAEQLTSLRVQAAGEPDPAIIDGLARHFLVPREYLTTTGPRADAVDKQLRLLVAARDAGVKRLALRGGTLDTEAMHAVFNVVKQIPPTAESLSPPQRQS